MANPPTEEMDAWVKRVLGFDPKAQRAVGAEPTSRRTAAQQFVTGVGNFVGDVVSEIGIGAEAAQQSALGLVDRIGEKGADAVEAVRGLVGWGTPPTAPPTGPVNLTSQAEEALPAPRNRTRLGLGERVVLTVTGGAGNWHVSGGTLSARAGTTVTMTASQRPGTATVTVDVGGTTRSLDFTVIAPSEVHMVRTGTSHENNSLPNAAMTGGVYIGPDDVNFVNTTNSEDDIRAKADGCWDEFNGMGHSPSAAPNPCSNQVVGGLGTHSPGDDNIASGWIPQPVPPNGDWSGTLTFDIPWHWQCGSGAGLIRRVLHSVTTDAAGTTTIAKAGASYTAALSP
jgi:hypothetical protein